MKITAVRATPINLPYEAPFTWSVGLMHGMSKTIIEVETDAGITGLGEAPSDAQAPLINDTLGPLLIGRDPFDIAGAELHAVPEWRSALNIGDAGLARAFGGVEIALWDIRGKAFDMPLYQLLGGAVRKDIPFTEYFAFRPESAAGVGETTPEAIVDYCLAMREAHGATVFEGKVGVGAPAQELAVVRGLREALGAEAVIRLDANYGWSLQTAIQMVRALEPLDVRNIEDPVFGFEAMARLRAQTAIPFSTHECNLPHAVAAGAPDAFVANIATLGGITNTLRFAAACDGMGRDFWFYSGDSGIMTAAYLHLSAATPSIREPHQSLSRWQQMDVIEEGLFRAVNNTVAVPEGPGLGVTLAPDKLRHCHQHYVDHGPIEEFDNPGRPGFLRLPRG